MVSTKTLESEENWKPLLRIALDEKNNLSISDLAHMKKKSSVKFIELFKSSIDNFSFKNNNITIKEIN